jgi:hypothetical protein
MICPECEMYYTEWHFTSEQARELFKAGGAPGEPLVPHFHVCPKPFPYETARNLCVSLGSIGAIVSPTMKARIVLGLKQGTGGA